MADQAGYRGGGKARWLAMGCHGRTI